MFILIISNFVIEISAEELVLKKLGTKPHKAEIIVSEEFKTYTLVEEDLDALMLYLGDLKLRKTLHLNKTSSSAKPILGENYSLLIKTAPDDTGIYLAELMHFNMGTNGKLYLRLHMEDRYRVIEPDSLQGLYELLKNMEVQN